MTEERLENLRSKLSSDIVSGKVRINNADELNAYLAENIVVDEKLGIHRLYLYVGRL